MNLTRSESRALGFIALLILLSLAGRVVGRPEPLAIDAPGMDLARLEADSRGLLEQPGPAPLAHGEKIDPNTASEKELVRLPGVGSGLAAKIVADRKRHGRFRTATDLTRVPGVGAAMVGKWTPHLALPAGNGGGSRSRTRVTPTPRAASNRGGGARRGSNGSRPPDGPVDLRTATAADLERIPGIGPALARRILAYRDSAGGIGSLEALQRVRGIGAATAKKLAPFLRLGT